MATRAAASRRRLGRATREPPTARRGTAARGTAPIASRLVSLLVLGVRRDAFDPLHGRTFDLHPDTLRDLHAQNLLTERDHPPEHPIDDHLIVLLDRGEHAIVLRTSLLLGTDH